jgi:hypothetical protein
MGRAAFCRTAAVMATIAATAAGCGDDERTNADFVKDANAVCKRHYATISAAASKLLAGGKLPTPAQFGKLAQGTIIPQYDTQIGELRDVEPTDAKKARYEKWLSDSEALAAKLKADPKLVQQPPKVAAVNGQGDKLGLAPECHIGAG